MFRYVLYYLYFLFRNLTTPLYQLFICAITDTWHILVKNKRMKGILIIPYLLDCVVLLSNPFHHKVFYFDQNLVYTRGPLIYVLYLIYFVRILATFITIRYICCFLCSFSNRSFNCCSNSKKLPSFLITQWHFLKNSSSENCFLIIPLLFCSE